MLGKFQRSRNIGSKSAKFGEDSASIVTLTPSEGQHSSLRLRGSKLQKWMTDYANNSLGFFTVEIVATETPSIHE